MAQGGGEPDPMLTALLDLPEDADPVLVADAIEAAMRAPGAAMRLSQLEDALDMVPDRWRGVRAGVILWATDLARDGEDEVHASQLTAFLAAGQDAELLDDPFLNGVFNRDGSGQPARVERGAGAVCASRGASEPRLMWETLCTRRMAWVRAAHV